MQYVSFSRLMLCFVVIMMSQFVFARMYQWVDPSTGTTQLSGKPPAWYRSNNGGPDVFVFDDGRLVDDSSVKVDADMRRRMRQQALQLVEEDKQAAKAEERQKKMVQTTDEPSTAPDLDHAAADFFNEPDEDELKKTAQNLNGKDLEKLRKIISDWEAEQTENAK